MNGLFPLAMTPPGSEVVVAEIRAGRGLSRKLMEMGFLPGTKVRVLMNGPGPVLVELMGSRVALGHGIAMKILVRGG